MYATLLTMKQFLTESVAIYSTIERLLINEHITQQNILLASWWTIFGSVC